MARGKGKPAEYALYRGGEFVDVGTGREIVERNGIKKQTFYFLVSNAYAKRKKKMKRPGCRGWEVVKLEDEEGELRNGNDAGTFNGSISDVCSDDGSICIPS